MLPVEIERIERHAASIWAKSTTKAGEWQPLWTHLIDVGVVARTLAERWLTAAGRRSLARGLGLGEDDAVAWCAALAGLHDLGKATPHFQLLSALDARRLQELGVALPNATQRFRHELLTAILLPDLLAPWTELSGEVRLRFARLLGGHHGVFSNPTLHAEAGRRKVVGAGTWPDARALIVRKSLTALRVPPDCAPTRVSDDAAVRSLGLTIMADWLASAPEVCPYRAHGGEPPPAIDCAERVAALEAELPGRLEQLGLNAPSRRSRTRAFDELFPGLAPRAGQRIVEELASELDHPGLLLVEDATGAGKTEAAFVVLERALAALSARGAVVALPTRATSEQAFRRLRNFLRGVDEQRGELHLVHGSAAMSVDYEALRHAAPPVEPVQVYDDERASGLRASAWFAQRRRGLLATFAVGTIDQALMAALPVRHHALRLAGLADRTVVLDEIHAYDTYMSTLLERLLEWLGALSTTVVVLTATLPAARRAQLLAAYARGAGLDSGSVPSVRYPRVVALSRAQSAAVRIEHHRRVRCRVELVRGGDDGAPLGRRTCAAVRAAVECGGCVAVVMNTVARAQSAYIELSGVIGAKRRRLLHARFRFFERDRLEREAIDWFGPPGRGSRPRGAVLVATQVIEQSLDIDFDLLVSDLAPIDLLLQRRGRLHRHARQRPPELADPRMLVLASERDGVPRFDPGSSRVYAPHVLLRTWLALRNHGSVLTTPDDVESLIEVVYGQDDPPHDSRVRPMWDRTRAELDSELEADAQRARAVRIPAPNAIEPFDARPLSGASDEESSADLRAATRLGESVSAVMLEAAEHELAARPLTPSTIRALLERAISFSTPRLVHTVRAQQSPGRWQRNALLQDHRLIELDQSGQWSTPPDASRRLSLRLDPELGVVELSN